MTKEQNRKKWQTTGGAVKPVKLSEVKFVNKPKKKGK